MQRGQVLSLSAYPIVIPGRVVWGEMDAFRHVNNTVFFRYFESVRIALFESIGYLDWMRENGSGPILASTSCRFRRPLTWPDEIEIGAGITEVSEDRFGMNYAVWSQAQEVVVATGEGVVVHYDYSAACKAPLPEILRSALCTLREQTS